MNDKNDKLGQMTEDEAHRLYTEAESRMDEREWLDKANIPEDKEEPIAEKPMNLASKLVKIMSEAGSIEKLGYNAFNKYAYIKESDISKKMQELFSKYNVFVLANVVSNKATPISNADGSKRQIFSQVETEYTFINGDIPEETYTVKAYGEGLDTGDKAGYKASTGCHKYFLIRNFNLGSDEDAEKETPDIGSGRPQPVPPRQPQQGQGQKPSPQGSLPPKTAAPNKYNNVI